MIKNEIRAIHDLFPSFSVSVATSLGLTVAAKAFFEKALYHSITLSSYASGITYL